MKNWDMLIPTALYLLVIAAGLIAYTIVGLSHS